VSSVTANSRGSVKSSHQVNTPSECGYQQCIFTQLNISTAGIGASVVTGSAPEMIKAEVDIVELWPIYLPNLSDLISFRLY
jgi:hypothetical protein